MKLRNPVFTADGRIDCEIEHPVHGWIPFTASADDPEALGRSVHEDALAMKPAPYVPPDAAAMRAAMPPLSRRQVFAGLVASGLMTGAEALASAITVPAAVEAAILTLPKDRRDAARVTFCMFTEVRRTDLLVALLGASGALDDAALDAFWATYAAI